MTADRLPAPLVIVSNRGPVNFVRDPDGELRPNRGAGGLVSGIAPLVAGRTDVLWIAAALSEGDRAAARAGIEDGGELRVHLLDVEDAVLRPAYDVICNATLWFVHHGLFDLSRDPRFDPPWFSAWDAYRRYNQCFATAVCEAAAPNAVVLIQDYHLALVARLVAAERPDLKLAHFSHTPFARPDELAILPRSVRDELLQAMAAHHLCSFHTDRWRNDFLANYDEASPPHTLVAPLGPDPVDLRRGANSDATRTAGRTLDQQLAGRALILRVDRIELSKNLLRGFAAYEVLLEEQPRWRENVVFGAFVYPSREGVPAYAAYRVELDRVVDEINRRWSTATWTPIVFNDDDNFPTSLSALQRYDVLLVNPIRDGLNLVAKEGPLINERRGSLVLSTEAGAWEDLSPHAFGVNPFDVTETAAAMHQALSLDPETRRSNARALAASSAARTPADWLNDQLRAIAMT